MKKLAFLMVGLALLCSTALTAKEDSEKDPLKEAKCVVSGKAINPEATVDYKGGKVYFCCPGCPGAFKKDTAKFAAKANHQLVMTGQYKQVKCPMSGKDVKPSTTISVGGVDVAFCCPNCEGAAKKAQEADKADEKSTKAVDLVFGDKPFEKGFELVKK